MKLATLLVLLWMCLAMGRFMPHPPGGDLDGDGIPNEQDNCIEIPNAGILSCDSDGDGYGNVCDCDFDQDGICWASDLTIFVNHFGTAGGGPTDMNCDGLTGGPDYGLYLQSFQGSTTKPAKPGPSGLLE